jgi:putative ABC transport system permease protein
LPVIINHNLVAMLKNYFKIAWRNLLKNKGFSAINIFGLAIGITVALLIGLWIVNELSYDNFHKNKNQIYRVLINGVSGNSGEKFTMNSVALPLAETFKKEIPGIKAVAETNWEGKQGLKAGDKKFTKYGTEVAADFFKIFQFKFLRGNAATALQQPDNIVLTESAAKSLFGTADAMNQTVRWNNVSDLKVTGIVEDIPQNSYFGSFEYFMNFAHYENRQEWVKRSRTAWDNFSFQMYVELDEKTTQAQVESKIKGLLQLHDSTNKSEVALHPLTKWRLYNEFRNWKANGGLIDYIKMFGVIGFLVLLIACINFMNLSTARSEKRAREVGVRKSVGSGRSSLVFQFLGESVLLAALSFITALLLLILLLPYFNTLIDSKIQIPYSNPFFWMICFAVILFTGLIAGSYPAMYLSSFSAIKVLKGTFKTGKAGSWPRRILVTAQFTASVALIVSTIVVYRQIQKIQSRPAGFNPTGVISVDMKEDLVKNYDVLKQEMLATGMIESVTKASNPVNWIWNNWRVDYFPGMEAGENMATAAIAISPDYFKTLQIKIKEGREFYSDGSNTDSASVIINEAAVKRMRMKNPLGQFLTLGDKKAQIIGIAENTIMSSPFEPVGPAMFVYIPGWASTLMFRVKSNVAVNEAIAKITPLFNKHNPAFPFEYTFVDEEYGDKIRFEKMVGKLAGIFALLTILISCLGLLGLSAYVAEQRTKEVGIRKVLGASVFNLWQMLSKDFIILVVVSSIIALPVAYYYMNGWLQKYSYRTDMPWWVFALAVAGALFVTMVTVSFQSVKAAIANPVKSLRTE